MTRRFLSALGTSACLTAVVLSAVAAGLRAVDRELSTYRVEIRNVPRQWVTDFHGETPRRPGVVVAHARRPATPEPPTNDDGPNAGTAAMSEPN